MACCMCEKYNWSDPQEVVYIVPGTREEYCVFHAPAEHKGVSIDEFNEMVSERIQASIGRNSYHSDCYLSGTIFPGSIGFNADNPLPNISFYGAHFLEVVSFRGVFFPNISDFRRASFQKGADFGGVTFRNVTSFRKACFGAGVTFSTSVFGAKSDFDEAEFNGGAHFADVKFKQASFAATIFGGVANFHSSVFDSSAPFSDARFLDNAIYKQAHFVNSYANFIGATFKKQADFSLVSFDKSVSFKKTTFRGETLFSQTTFKENATFQQTGFKDRVLFESFKTGKETIMSFISCTLAPFAVLFRKCDPTCLDLVEQRDLTFINFDESSWEKNGSIKACTEESQLQLTRDFYQRMKAKYKNENNEYEASKWHVAEKEAQLRMLSQQGSSKFLWTMLWLYKFSSGFGEKPARASFVLFVVLVMPLLFLTIFEVSQHVAWLNFDQVKVNQVFKEWLKFIPLTRAIDKNELGGLHALMIFWQLLVSLQAALFAFALRNNFRR